MISDEQIRAVCARGVAGESDAEELKQLLAGWRMLCTQYVREHSHVNPSPPSQVRVQRRGIRTRGNRAA